MPAPPAVVPTSPCNRPASTHSLNEAPLPDPTAFETRIRAAATLLIWNQPSTVTSAGCRVAVSGTLTYPLVPSKVNALPTLPEAVDAPPTRLPLCVLALSTAFPSARYQATAPLGRDTHVAPLAVRVMSPRLRA